MRAARLARASLLIVSRRSSIATGVGGSHVVASAGASCRPKPPRRLLPKPPSAYNSMLPSSSTGSSSPESASKNNKTSEADNDLDPLPALSLEVCGRAVPLGEMRVTYPSSPTSSSSSSPSSSPSSSSCAVLHVPCSVDALMDCYIASGNADADPYWCRPWPSGLALGALLLREPGLVRGRRVLDLGCGAGVAGIAAALAGAAEVVLADRDPAAAECAALSARASLLLRDERERSAGADASSSCSSSPSQRRTCVVSSRVVDWDQAAAEAAQSRDSSSSSDNGRFDVVLASDVLYDSGAAAPLSAALRALVKTGGEGVVLVADPARRAPRHRAAFAEEVTRPKRRERDAGDPHLVLESWEAVDEASGERVGGGGGAAGAVLLLLLRSAGGSSTLSVKWP